MRVRLLKSYTLNNGKKLCIGYVVPRRRIEATMMIENKIAEEYNGPIPPKKIKTDFFKPKN